jgi:hypothetical protein
VHQSKGEAACYKCVPAGHAVGARSAAACLFSCWRVCAGTKLECA